MAPALVALEDLRDTVAAILEPDGGGEPYVFADIVDSLEPPALVVDQGDPWIEPGAGGIPSMGPCLYTARVVVLCVAGRLEPGAGIDALEQLEAYVLDRMRAAGGSWALEQVSARGQHDLAGVTYLAATVTYTITTAI